MIILFLSTNVPDATSECAATPPYSIVNRTVDTKFLAPFVRFATEAGTATSSALATDTNEPSVEMVAPKAMLDLRICMFYINSEKSQYGFPYVYIKRIKRCNPPQRPSQPQSFRLFLLVS